MTATSYELAAICISLPAKQAFTSLQYQLVCVTAAGKASSGLTNNPPVGVLQDAPAAGYPASIAVEGITKIKLGGSVTAGQRLCNNSGANTAIAVGVLTGVFVFGIALEDGVSGDLIPVLLLNNPLKRTKTVLST